MMAFCRIGFLNFDFFFWSIYVSLSFPYLFSLLWGLFSEEKINKEVNK